MKSKYKTLIVIAFVFAGALSFIAASGLSMAKNDYIDYGRSEFYGIIQSRPQNSMQGEWVIGGRIFIADEKTQFDQSEGDLAVGSCAKVKMRNGRVHEIDSEPLNDCK